MPRIACASRGSAYAFSMRRLRAPIRGLSGRSCARPLRSRPVTADQRLVQERVLIVDEDLELREALASALGREGYSVLALEPGPDAGDRIGKDGPFELVLTDLATCEGGGLEIMDLLRRRWPGTEVICLVEPGALDAAMQALRLGAADYLRKPVKPVEVGLAVRRTLLTRRLMRENESLRAGRLRTSCRWRSTC